MEAYGKGSQLCLGKGNSSNDSAFPVPYFEAGIRHLGPAVIGVLRHVGQDYLPVV